MFSVEINLFLIDFKYLFILTDDTQPEGRVSPRRVTPRGPTRVAARVSSPRPTNDKGAVSSDAVPDCR